MLRAGFLVYFFFAATVIVELDHVVRGGKSLFRAKVMIVLRRVQIARHPLDSVSRGCLWKAEYSQSREGARISEERENFK